MSCRNAYKGNYSNKVIKGNNTIKYNHREKSLKIPFIIYTDLECLLEKMSTCQNDPNKSSTTKVNKLRHQIIQYLLIVHLMNQKIELVIIEEMIV